MHGGELVVETLIGHGISHVFGIPGGQANAFYDALASRRDRITHVLVRDERNAVYAADAFARITNRLAVCDATVGPGAVKFPSGLMEAYNSSVPVLALVSDHPRNAVLLQDRGRISQGGDQMSVLRAFAKETLTIPSTELIPDVLAAAIHTAVTGRPGPVVVEVPQDVFNATVQSVAPRTGEGRFPKFRCVPRENELERAAQVLAGARRPLILAGGGVHLSIAAEQVGRLAQILGAAVATTISGKGSVAESNPGSVGVLGEFGSPLAKTVADQADVIVAVGYKHSQMASHRWAIPRQDQLLIHIDIDPIELGRITTPTVALWGDARETLELLIGTLSGRVTAREAAWDLVIRAAREGWRDILSREWAEKTEPIWPQAVAGLISAAVDHSDYIVVDASFSSGWGAAFVEAKAAGRKMLFPRGAAGLGYSIPAALGVAMAAPAARIVCIAGDGAAGYFAGELATVASLNLPITCVVLNNSVLSWSKWTQRLNFRGQNQSVHLSNVDFEGIARALGLNGHTATRIHEFEAGLNTALRTRKPTLISVITDEWQTPSFSYREALAKRGKEIGVPNEPY